MHDDERDILIERIIHGEAGPEDWQRFRAAADRDGAVWRELFAAGRERDLLCAAVDRATDSAAGVTLPARANPARGRAPRAWGGWALAAAVALVWVISAMLPAPDPQNRGAAQDLGRSAVREVAHTPDEAFETYLDLGRAAGRVVAEVPQRVLLEARPLDDGSGVELLYLRQVVERDVVDHAYRLSEDEAGNGVPISTPVIRAGGRAM